MSFAFLIPLSYESLCLPLFILSLASHLQKSLAIVVSVIPPDSLFSTHLEIAFPSFLTQSSLKGSSHRMAASATLKALPPTSPASDTSPVYLPFLASVRIDMQVSSS